MWHPIVGVTATDMMQLSIVLSRFVTIATSTHRGPDSATINENETKVVL